jgi:hypothetical protein
MQKDIVYPIKKKRSDVRNRDPALTPEALEQQAASLAYMRAIEQLENGTASSQIISFFLNKEKDREKDDLTKRKLKAEIALAEAKKKSLETQDERETKAEKALQAFRLYSGQGGIETGEDDDDDNQEIY